MADKIWINGNFLVAEDSVVKDIYFKIGVENVMSLRDTNDNFSFNFNIPIQTANGEVNFLQLGAMQSWDINDQILPYSTVKRKTTFVFADIVDENNLPYADADTLEQYLNDNLGVSPTGTGGGQVDSVTGLNTDNSDPVNPIVQISVDGVTITGTGTSGSPLVSVGGGGGNTIYTADDSVVGNRIVSGSSSHSLSWVQFTNILHQLEPPNGVPAYVIDVDGSALSVSDKVFRLYNNDTLVLKEWLSVDKAGNFLINES